VQDYLYTIKGSNKPNGPDYETAVEVHTTYMDYIDCHTTLEEGPVRNTGVYLPYKL